MTFLYFKYYIFFVVCRQCFDIFGGATEKLSGLQKPDAQISKVENVVTD